MFLSQEEFKGRMELIINDQYNAHLPALRKFLAFTSAPYFRDNGTYSLAIQLGMLKSLSKFEDTIKQGNALLKKEKDLKRKSSLRKALMINEACVKIIKTIADGIAWRALNCHRPRLMVMSDNSNSGPVNPNYQGLERLKTRRGFFIINDLTRCLRIADITHVFKDGKIIIEEFKDNGKTLKTMGTIIDDMIKYRRQPNPQELRQIIVQTAIIEDRLAVPDRHWNKVHKADFLTLNFKIPSHLKKVKELIKRADKYGFAHALLEDGYYIEIHAYDKLISEKSEFKDAFSKMKTDYEATKPSWLKEKNADIESLTNYDALMDIGDEFPRNITPASILPFSAKNRLRIMSGHLFVRVSISNAILKEKFKASGWSVKELDYNLPMKTRKDFARKRSQTKGNFYTYGDNTFTPLSLSRDDNGRIFHISPPYELIPIMLSSFHSLDFLVKAVNEIYEKRHESRRGSIMINFANEKSLFFPTKLTDLFYSMFLAGVMIGVYLRSPFRNSKQNT